MLHALQHACYFRSSRCSAEQECEACNRQNHMATYSAQLGGVMCDATALYREGWMSRCVAWLCHALGIVRLYVSD